MRSSPGLPGQQALPSHCAAPELLWLREQRCLGLGLLLIVPQTFVWAVALVPGCVNADVVHLQPAFVKALDPPASAGFIYCCSKYSHFHI